MSSVRLCYFSDRGGAIFSYGGLPGQPPQHLLGRQPGRVKTSQPDHGRFPRSAS
jgi:hypothetical protein